jgi:hypothetical protein
MPGILGPRKASLVKTLPSAGLFMATRSGGIIGCTIGRRLGKSPHSPLFPFPTTTWLSLSRRRLKRGSAEHDLFWEALSSTAGSSTAGSGDCRLRSVLGLAEGRARQSPTEAIAASQAAGGRGGGWRPTGGERCGLACAALPSRTRLAIGEAMHIMKRVSPNPRPSFPGDSLGPCQEIERLLPSPTIFEMIPASPSVSHQALPLLAHCRARLGEGHARAGHSP